MSRTSSTESLPAKRVAFIVHAMSLDQLVGYNWLTRLLGRSGFGRWLIEWFGGLFGPILKVASADPWISAKNGQEVKVKVYALPATPRVLACKRLADWFTFRLWQVCHLAKLEGCCLAVLGGHTSSVGDAGLTLNRHSPLPATAGNACTAFRTNDDVARAASQISLKLSQATVMIVGSGSIGRFCLYDLIRHYQVRDIVMVGRTERRLDQLSQEISLHHPEIHIRFTCNVREYLPEVHAIILATTDTRTLVELHELPAGCIVCDVSEPSNIVCEGPNDRPDVMVFDVSKFRLAETVTIKGSHLPFPHRTVFPCLMEGIILAQQTPRGKKHLPYTQGRSNDPNKVSEMRRWAREHGHEPDILRHEGTAVPQHNVIRTSKSRAQRYAPEQAMG